LGGEATERAVFCQGGREELDGGSEVAEVVVAVDPGEVERVAGGGEFSAEFEEIAFEPAAAEELVVEDAELHWGGWVVHETLFVRRDAPGLCLKRWRVRDGAGTAFLCWLVG
jgi:hypothetical protein